MLSDWIRNVNKADLLRQRENLKNLYRIYIIIFASDLRTLYTSKVLDPDGGLQSLQDKVQFDLRFYFMRRGSENIDTFKKDTFSVHRDIDTNLLYVCKDKDEMTKNHKENSTELVSGFMPEIRGSKYCLVRSFQMMEEHLNPDCEFLFQKPRHPKDIDVKDQNIWYCNAKIGVNPLSSFMSRMSHAADLSCVYTNHSICVTGATFLSRNNFSAKQIMSVTDHHSINSLAIYQKVSSNEKLCMGMSINYFLNSDNPEVNTPVVHEKPEEQNQVRYRPIAPKDGKIHKNTARSVLAQKRINSIVQHQQGPPPKMPSTSDISNALVVHSSQDDFQNPPKNIENDPLANFNLLEYMENLSDDGGEVVFSSSQEERTMQSNEISIAQKSTVQKIVKKSPTTPIFHGCKIGAIHFHVHKK